MVTSRSFFSRFADFVCLSAHAPVAWEDLRSGPKKAAHAQADSIPLNCEVNVRRSRVVCFPMDHLRALHGSYLDVHFLREGPDQTVIVRRESSSAYKRLSSAAPCRLSLHGRLPWQ